MNHEHDAQRSQDELRHLRVVHYATWLAPTWFIPWWPTLRRTPPSRRKIFGRHRSGDGAA